MGLQFLVTKQELLDVFPEMTQEQWASLVQRQERLLQAFVNEELVATRLKGSAHVNQN